jgi:L-lactate dehydrogenase complex protein LldG
MSGREAFLQRVRQAVRAGNQAGQALPLPERGNLGYQGAGADPVQCFCAQLVAAGGHGYVAETTDAAWEVIAGLLKKHVVRQVLLSSGGLVERLDLAGRLPALGITATPLNRPPAAPRDAFFAADLGITNVYRLIAETGSVVMATQPDEPRSLSLLPPVHIALAEPGQILPDLFDLFPLYAGNALPSCLSVITGPSKTGDIELRLVTGVHGPGEVHVIVCK